MNIYEDLAQLRQQFVAIDRYRVVVCHGDEATYARCLASRFIREDPEPDEIDRIVEERIAFSHSRPDGRSAPLRFDDLNVLLRQIREQCSRARTSG